MTYDYKSLRLHSPLMSMQTQTLVKLWVDKCFSRQASNSDELAKQKHSKLAYFDQETTYNKR